MAVNWHNKIIEVLDPKEVYQPLGEITIGDMTFDDYTDIRYNSKKRTLSFRGFYIKLVISIEFLTSKEIRTMLKSIVNVDTLESPYKKRKDHE